MGNQQGDKVGEAERTSVVFLKSAPKRGQKCKSAGNAGSSEDFSVTGLVTN